MAESLRAGLQERLNFVLDNNVVQGASLEVDRYWFEWAAYQWGRPCEPPWERGNAWPWIYLYEPLPEWNFDRKPPAWDSHCAAMGYGEGASPILIRVVLREGSRLEFWRDKELLRRFEGHPVLYEARPPAVGVGMLKTIVKAIGWPWGQEPDAISVGRSEPNSAGTLGGYLACPVTGRMYLVSCAHVLGPTDPTVYTYTPGPLENRNSTRVGIVRFSQIPPLKGEGQECNMLAMPNAGRLDLAVAELVSNERAQGSLDPRPSFHTLRPSAKMSPYQPVVFIGKESGRVEAQLSAVTLWHEIDFREFGDGPAGPRCFGTLFELSDFAGDKQDLAKEGDSGAWVFDEVGDMRCWNGMLIARQGKRAYGCYADFILQALADHRDFPGGLAIRW